MSAQGINTVTNAPPSVQEFSIRVPKNVKKKYQVMRFTSSVNMDFSKWSQVKIERENNMREFKGNEEEIPKFGAGSEFGRDAREEARRKKYGIVSKKYRPEDQPWILKVGGKTGKKFRGIREGGVAENAAYYVFTHSPDGGIDAFPLTEWYNFQPIQRYKALTAEEAEEEFGRRNKNWNLFSLMMRKRLNGGEEVEGEEPEEGKGKKTTVKKKELKISDMDDWMDSDEDSGSNSNSEEEKQDKEDKKDKKDKKGPKKGAPAKKKKKKASDDEAFEESDDGDEEGREVDYISDSSESESDHEGKVNKQMQGVAEEDALRKLLSSGEEDEDEEKKEEVDKESETEDKEKVKADADKAMDKEKKSGVSSGKKSKKKKKLATKVKKEEGNDTSSDFSSDISDSDSDGKKKQPKDPVKGSKEANSAGSSRSGTPTKDVLGGSTGAPEKRKISAILELNAIKRARLDNFASATLAPYIGDSRITEDAVRRYLMRKPMTTTELLQKFKSKKTGLTSDQLVNIMTQILKRINPVKQMIKDKMYLSIKA